MPIEGKGHARYLWDVMPSSSYRHSIKDLSAGECVGNNAGKRCYMNTDVSVSVVVSEKGRESITLNDTFMEGRLGNDVETCITLL